MSQTNKKTREERLLGVGLEGSASRSEALGTADPRQRRGSQRELDFHKRFDPTQFRVDENNRVSLVVEDEPTTRTIHLPFLRQHAQASGNPAVVDTSAAGGTPVYASPTANWQVSDYGYFAVPLPVDLDRSREFTIVVGCVERNNIASALVSWTLAVWAWEPGQDLTRSADKSVTIVDQALAAQDVDTRCEFTVPPGVLTRDAVSLKFKLTRDNATGTDPSGVGVHEILMTYGVKHYHTHG